MRVRVSPSSPTVVLELTTENGRISLGETDGSITLTVSGEVMATIPSDKYVYDLEMVAPSFDVYVYKLLYGNFVVRAEVTR